MARSQGLVLEPVWNSADSAEGDRRGGSLPAALAERFPGQLAVSLRSDRPTVIANFVSSIDGVVALGPTEPGAGGGEISGFSDSDRFMMALLRGLADVVIVGAGTVRAGSHHQWTPRHLQRALAPVFAEWRSAMDLAPQPTTVIVTAQGNVDPHHSGLNAPDVPVVLATTRRGADDLARLPFAPNVSIEPVADGSSVSPADLLALVTRLGTRLALCEGGPHLFGELVKASLIDELFLTLAPQMIGRDQSVQRFALVEGTRLSDESGPGRWARLEGVRRAGDDLFLRYRFGE
jgi:riboflavin biosynthesis pyrimidine reductase